MLLSDSVHCTLYTVAESLLLCDTATARVSVLLHLLLIVVTLTVTVTVTGEGGGWRVEGSSIGKEPREC